MNKDFVFISGCPRTGTTAMVELLNRHPKIIMGMERYKNYASKKELTHLIKPELFSPDVFFNVSEDQTDVCPSHLEWEEKHEKMYSMLKNRWNTAVRDGQDGGFAWGDKVPNYYRLYDELDEAFDNRIKWIFTTRDIMEVALSFNYRAEAAIPGGLWRRDADYKMAVVKWNESLKEAWLYLKRKPGKMMVVDHASIFSDDQSCLLELMKFIDMEPTEDFLESHMMTTLKWKTKRDKRIPIPEQEEYIKKHADIELYEAFLKKHYLIS